MRSTIVTGHRGAAGLEPENTLRSFRRACDLGVDHVETDVHVSRDAQVVCIHDASVDRTTGSAGEIKAMTLAEIQALDAGQGERIPTLRETLAVTRGKSVLQIELKSDDSTDPTLAVLESLGITRDEVLLISFSRERLDEVRRGRPDLRTSLLLRWLDPESVSQAHHLKASAISAYHSEVTEEWVRTIHEAGLKLHTWTVNDSAEMQRLLRLGVDGIATDRPDILVRLADELTP